MKTKAKQTKPLDRAARTIFDMLARGYDLYTALLAVSPDDLEALAKEIRARR